MAAPLHAACTFLPGWLGTPLQNVMNSVDASGRGQNSYFTLIIVIIFYCCAKFLGGKCVLQFRISVWPTSLRQRTQPFKLIAFTVFIGAHRKKNHILFHDWRPSGQRREQRTRHHQFYYAVYAIFSEVPRTWFFIRRKPAKANIFS